MPTRQQHRMAVIEVTNVLRNAYDDQVHTSTNVHIHYFFLVEQRLCIFF